MKYGLLLTFAVLLLSGCTTTQDLPPISQIEPSLAEPGTLASKSLIAQASAGIEKITGTTSANSELVPFIAQQPVGSLGSRAWREIWVVKTPERAMTFLLTFRESNTDSTNVAISQLKNIERKPDLPPKKAEQTVTEIKPTYDCPGSASAFTLGQSSEVVKGCLGKPNNIDDIVEGGYMYLYAGENQVIRTYTFNRHDQLIDFNEYKAYK
ncbi:hypothetical protein [Thalassotalea maritima]|uniref:hypothetical protein n=1 Tax=Thalassotalea maritima TaxID=3242416 RepID=UPI003529AB82